MVIIKKHHFILIIISWMLVVLVQAKTHLFHISELYEEDRRIVFFPLIYISKGQWFFAVLKNKCALWVQAIFQCPKHPLVHYNGLLFSLSNGRKSFSNSNYFPLLHMHQLTTKCIRPPSHIATVYFLVLMRFGGLRVHTSIIFVHTQIISSARQMCLNVLQDIFIQEAEFFSSHCMGQPFV